MVSKKLVIARIKKILYTGKNIGSNLILNLNIGDLKFSQKIELKAGQKKENIEIFKEFIEENGVNISCQLKEDDPIFDDLSDIKTFNLLLEGDSVLHKTITFAVEEQEIKQQKNTAYITIELELDITDTIFYVGLLGDGWLKFIDKKTIHLKKDDVVNIFLPYGTKIELLDKDEEYLYFVVKEGLNANGNKLGISIKNIQYLLKNIKYQPPAKLIYSVSQKTLEINGSKYQATEHPSNLLEKGMYKLFLADAAHSGGARYKKIAKYAKTWFRLNDKDKYLHVGRISAGCITITELKKWDDIYNQIILARAGDGETIGTIEVID